MIKCPNCGSTAQVKRLRSIEGENIVVEIYQCGCGAKIERHLKRTMDVAWSPTGTLISQKKFDLRSPLYRPNFTLMKSGR